MTGLLMALALIVSLEQQAISDMGRRGILTPTCSQVAADIDAMVASGGNVSANMAQYAATCR